MKNFIKDSDVYEIKPAEKVLVLLITELGEEYETLLNDDHNAMGQILKNFYKNSILFNILAGSAVKEKALLTLKTMENSFIYKATVAKSLVWKSKNDMKDKKSRFGKRKMFEFNKKSFGRNSKFEDPKAEKKARNFML